MPETLAPSELLNHRPTSSVPFSLHCVLSFALLCLLSAARTCVQPLRTASAPEDYQQLSKMTSSSSAPNQPIPTKTLHQLQCRQTRLFRKANGLVGGLVFLARASSCIISIKTDSLCYQSMGKPATPNFLEALPPSLPLFAKVPP